MNNFKLNPAHKDGNNPSTKDGDAKNYRNPEPLNCALEGKSMTISLVNGRVESGRCTRMGQFFMELVMGNGKPIIIAKSALVTVSVL